jgi:leucyl-tRNA synthetase
MSYYTIVHLLQGNVVGSTPGLLGIKPEECTREFWDYIFLNGQYNSE